MAVSMDQLVASLDSHCDVAANPFDTNRPHPRFSEYAHLREPASLLGDQETRRAKYLERQKSKREKVVNLQRRLLDEPEEEVDSQDADKKFVKNEERKNAAGSGQKKWTFTNQLMLSEWLVDIPPDLEENWVVKPCPRGRRMLVVAHQGSTKAYSKAGHIVATFPSALPSGSSPPRRGITILDCIWNLENRTYFVLDVLAWNNIVLLDCETEFRFYWLKTKLDENPEIQNHTDNNRNKFLALPSYECKENLLTELMSHNPMFFDGKDPGLDGLLFYHKENLYEHGSTPLVTWVKPFMMEDVLGIKVHQAYIDERPAGYCNQAAYIKDFEEAARAKKASFKKKGFWRRRANVEGQDNTMDCRDWRRRANVEGQDNTMDCRDEEISAKKDDTPSKMEGET